MGRE
jgi:hypothetical protein